MIAAFFRGSMWVLSFVLGNTIRKQQTRASQLLQTYRRTRRDVLDELPIDEEFRQWAGRLQLKPGVETLVVINPQEDPKTAHTILRNSVQPSSLNLIVEQLNRIENGIAGLEAHLAADEAGKLQANFEYVLDFSVSLTQTLLLAYAGQLEWRRFAVVLEEIELQSAQIMASLEERLDALEARLQEVSITRQLLTDVDKQLTAYNRNRSHWILALQVRCSAAYLRLCLPKSHQAFIVRQQQRMHNQVCQRREKFESADQAISQMKQSLPNAIRSSIQSLWQSTESPERALVDSSETDYCSRSLGQIEQLLSNPRKSLGEIRKFVSDRVSIVIATGADGRVEKLWRLTRRQWLRPRGASTSEPTATVASAS